jgi:catechol 2,3-dioxygenase-like lactoylglutathione lyase family enzyme
MAQSQTATHIRQVSTVAVPVADADRALKFYVDTLGFEKRRDVPFGQGARWVEVAPAGAITTIAMAPPGDNGIGLDTGIRLTTEDCEGDHRHLREQGVEVEDIIRFPGVPPMFSLRDPDGNTLYVVESQR